MRELTPAEIDEFLDRRDLWMILTTLDEDGFPHTVPMGHFRLDGDIYMGCRHPTHKTRNLLRDSRASMLLENGRGGPDLTGVLLQGRAEVIVDPERLLELKRRLARHRGEAEPDRVAPGIAYIRLRPERTISWKR